MPGGRGLGEAARLRRGARARRPAARPPGRRLRRAGARDAAEGNELLKDEGLRQEHSHGRWQDKQLSRTTDSRLESRPWIFDAEVPGRGNDSA